LDKSILSEKDDCLAGDQKTILKFKADFDHVVEGLCDGGCGHLVGMLLK
jgi:hypothetical protein